MDFQFNFQRVNASAPVTEYAEENFQKLGKNLFNQSHWHVTFKKSKLDSHVQVTVQTSWGKFQAEAKGEGFYHAIDAVAEKLSKQFAREKEKMQKHRKWERTKSARLSRLNASLEYDNRPFINRKVA